MARFCERPIFSAQQPTARLTSSIHDAMDHIKSSANVHQHLMKSPHLITWYWEKTTSITYYCTPDKMEKLHLFKLSSGEVDHTNSLSHHRLHLLLLLGREMKRPPTNESRMTGRRRQLLSPSADTLTPSVSGQERMQRDGRRRYRHSFFHPPCARVSDSGLFSHPFSTLFHSCRLCLFLFVLNHFKQGLINKDSFFHPPCARVSDSDPFHTFTHFSSL